MHGLSFPRRVFQEIFLIFIFVNGLLKVYLEKIKEKIWKMFVWINIFILLCESKVLVSLSYDV